MDMMGYLTFNRNLPFGALRVLTDSKWLWARNYSTPQEVLVELARDDDWQVRHSVAGNPKASARELELLAQDPHWVVRDRACRTRKRLQNPTYYEY